VTLTVTSDFEGGKSRRYRQRGREFRTLPTDCG